MQRPVRSSSFLSSSPSASTFSLSTIIISGFQGGCIDRSHQSWHPYPLSFIVIFHHHLKQCWINIIVGIIIYFQKTLYCTNLGLLIISLILWDTFWPLSTEPVPQSNNFLALLYVSLIVNVRTSDTYFGLNELFLDIAVGYISTRCFDVRML